MKMDSKPSKKPVVLCVDDEKIVLMSLKSQLKREFRNVFLVETVESGEEALELYDELIHEGFEIPLVVSDQIMPGMKGDALLTSIYAKNPNIKTILLTGQASPEAVGNAVNQANLYRYIAKPWDVTDLNLTVSEAVNSYFQAKKLRVADKLLERNYLALKDYSENLEKKVEERTQELRVALKQVEQQNIELQQANEHKSNFLARMSHELRTPLNAILGFTRIVKRRSKDVLPEKQRENLEKVIVSADHLLNLINDILDLSKVEAGHIDIDCTNFSAQELVQSCLDTSASLLRPGVVLTHRMEPDLPLLCSDEGKLRQILLNLLSNAAKFTHKGGIHVSVRREGEQLNIAVRDTGIGISEDALPRVFEEFQQADSSTTREYGGTGLGLPISFRLAQLLGGSLSAKSVKGQGSTFTLTVPLVSTASS